MRAQLFVLPKVLSGHSTLICPLLLCIVAGCGQNGATVTGVVTLDGKPLALASDARGTIVFQPVGGQGTTAQSLLDTTGHFRLATGASSNVAPGKYLVAISVVRLMPRDEGAEQGAKSVTPAKYASASTSGFEVNILPAENEFNFDMNSNTENNTASDAASNLPDSSVNSGQNQSSKRN
jgi:hypothetical protein